MNWQTPIDPMLSGRLPSLAALAAFTVLGPFAERSTAQTPGQVNNQANGKQFELKIIGPDGTAVPQATVEIRMRPAPTSQQIQRGEFIKPGPYGATVKADGDGRLIVALSTQPKYLVVNIQEPGYGPYWAEWNSDDHPERIPNQFVAKLEAGWSVGGVVVDGSGIPVQGATVHPSVKFKKRSGDVKELHVGTNLRTDRNGIWSFPNVPASMDQVHVAIDHPDFMPERRTLARSTFGIERGGKPDGKMILKHGVMVTGTVTDESGHPIRGALIRTKFHNEDRETTSGEDGTYFLAGCEPRMTRIVVSAKGRALELKEVRVEPDMEPVDFTLKPGGHIRVRVVDEVGNGIPKARIFFQRWRGPIDYFEFDHVSQYADENGVWEWNEAPLDEFKADICRPNGMQLSQQPLIARDEEYVFRPPSALVVSGNVIDKKTQQPIKRFRVIPGLRNSDPRIGMNWIPGDSFEASNGQYRIRLTHAYPAHLVRIEADGYQVAISRDIQTDEGKVKIDFQLQPAEDIAAAIQSVDGEPAAGAKIALGFSGSQISVKNGDIDDGSTYATRLDADETGRFSFPGRDEPFQLVITHATGFAYLKSSEGPIPSNISLTPWARVEGTFRVGPRPMPNVTLNLNNDAVHSYGDDVPNIFTHHETTTDLGGKFQFDRVFPGDGRIGRRILLMVDDGAMEVTSSKMMAVQLTAGETTQIDLGGDGRPVVGRLQSPPNHQEKVLWNFAIMYVRIDLPRLKTPPIPAAVQNDPKRRQAWWREWQLTEEGRAWQGMNAANEGMRKVSPFFSVSIDRDGTFRIDDVPPGNYALNVRFDQHAAGRLQNYQFSVPAGDENQSAQPVDLGVLTLER